MHSATDRSRNLAWALIAAALVVMPSTIGFAQSAEPEAAAAAPAATPADQPRSRRERRRAAQASPAELPVTEVRAAAPAEPVVESEEPEIVCKTMKLAGTKIGQRVCGTPEQWAARTRRTSEGARDAVQEISSRSAFPAAPEVPTAIP